MQHCLNAYIRVDQELGWYKKIVGAESKNDQPCFNFALVSLNHFSFHDPNYLDTL